MKRCQYCNSVIDENDKFCPFCGSKIESNENSNSDFTSTCMSCGAKLSKDDVYCRECGTINPFYEDVTVANTKANQENGYTNSENTWIEK